MAPTTRTKHIAQLATTGAAVVTLLMALAPTKSVHACNGCCFGKCDTKAVATQSIKSATAQSAPVRLPRFGDKGDMVLAVQRALMNNGFTLRGGATGVFDQNTRTTLRNFQKVVGLKVTGRVNAATARVLKITPGSATSSTAPSASFPFTLSSLPKRGQTGEAVVAVQQAIQAAGTTVRGGIDGVFGLGVTRSIEDFQRAKGLPVTGLLDQTTAAALSLVAPTQTPAAQNVSVTAPQFTTSNLPRRGERGDRVRFVQQEISSRGIAIRGGIDGVFGRYTTTAIRRFQRQNGLPITGILNAQTAYKLGLVEPPAMQLAAFPVQGPCSFTDTWHDPRGGGRLHIGVDIIAPRGNLVYAVADGVITRTYHEGRDKLSGNGVRLTMADGTYFFYGHFDAIAPGITVGTPVKAGQVVGTIGSTGNTTTPHLHLEIHPGGGEAINPFPIVKAIDACNVTTARSATAR
jgi:peptidoglycan hydrolase-like protein with peptidoglycan-binding domain